MRGGGDTEPNKVPVNDSAGSIQSIAETSDAINVHGTTNKRDPGSTGRDVTRSAKKKVTMASERDTLQEFNDLAGWIDHTICTEISKKLIAASAELIP